VSRLPPAAAVATVAACGIADTEIHALAAGTVAIGYAVGYRLATRAESLTGSSMP